ncbi:3-oxoacyl-ACP synthase [Aquimarina rhabdastrellae]
MEKKYYIKHYCAIKNEAVYKNGEVYHEDETSDNLKDFAKGIYKKLELKYPKFYKMDELCKFSFLASEILLMNEEIDEDTALVFANKASSLVTDRKHQETINDPENYFPSPAIFVYTLPNIALGEISIKHKFKSENAFFVNEKFDSSFIMNYSQMLLDTQKATKVICGWVDLDSNKYDVFLTYLTREEGKQITIRELTDIYNNDYGRISRRA